LAKSSVPSPTPLGLSIQQGKKWLTAASSPHYATGLMLANDGAWNGQQIVPRQWLLDATAVPRDSYLRNTVSQSWGYGYQVVKLPGERRMFLLLGISGQGLFVDPESKLVMVQTAVRKLPVGDPKSPEAMAL